MPDSSRRQFLSAGLMVPIAGAASKLPLFQSQASEGKPTSRPASGTPQLAYRTLGKTGLKVTSLAFGCMTTTDPSVIERAADIGINLFDTARGYQNGNNERMVGAALKKVRTRVFISSKSMGRTKEQALAELDTSLRELGTDYLDIWYLHMKNEPEQVTEDLLEAQRVAKQSGKTRFAGVSTHFNMDRMLAYLAKLGQTDVVLTTYNFAMRSVAASDNTNPNAPKTDMAAAIQSARNSGLGIVAMKVLAGGLTRVLRGDRVYGANPQELSNRLGQPGVSLAAIKWALRNKSLDAAEVCITSHEQLDENLRAMAEPFADSDERLLTAQLAAITSSYCRMCGACGGFCDKGVPVPDVLRFLTYAEGYGQFALGREKYLQLAPEIRAVRCDDCARCSVHCPYEVQVAARLSRAQELFA
jgi:aryl-alcohol dehydrogenase-like predicted oxidoreductase